jgi:beta-hydroxylase
MLKRFRKWLGKLGMKLGKKIVWGLDGLFGRASKVGDKAWYDEADFPWIKAVEKDWALIRAELDPLLAHREHLPNFQDLSPDQRYLTKDDGWKTVFFYAYGLKTFGNCKRCPNTARILKRIPGMKTAMFSIFAPGKRLPPHRGPFKGVLRYQLALMVPEPADACAIRVGGEVRHWQEGKSLVFDDTYDHEAWNDTEGVRAVLFVDFMRPMRFPAALLNRVFIWLIAFSPFVIGGAGKQLAWEKRFEKVVNAEREAA